MATIKYAIRSAKDPAKIFLRFREGRTIDLFVSTDYLISPKHWNPSTGKVRATADNSDKQNVKDNLDDLKTFVFKKFNEDKGTGIGINKEWLNNVIDVYKNPVLEIKTDGLVDLIKAYKEEMKIKINPKTGKPIATTTIRNFNTTIRRVELFEKHKGKNYDIHEVDLDFHADFVKFLRHNQNLAQNSISKDVKQLKTICIDARDKGYVVDQQVLSKKFNAPLEKTTFVTITEDEIKEIKKFKGTDYLMNARDWLIIGCWTGCRVGDLMSLTKANIHINPKKQKFIRYTQSKTGKQVDLPIHPDVEAILKKNGDFPRPISDQRFNEWIKLVCEQAKMTQLVHGTRQNPETHKKEVGTFKKYELVRSHTCRRSFATNHYNKLPNKLIMAVTGHSTEKMLLHYIGETENAHLDDFMNVWAKA